MKKYTLLIVYFLFFCTRIIIISILAGISPVGDVSYYITELWLGLGDGSSYIYPFFLFRTIDVLFFLFVICFHIYKGRKDTAWKLNKILMISLIYLFIIRFIGWMLNCLVYLMFGTGDGIRF